jgi:hypothetical protein
MRSSKLLSRLFLLSIIFFATQASAQSFCFLSASTFYEQVYCELQAKGATSGLPPFHQFKRNDETIQAVLLKRPAERAGIVLPLPKKINKPDITPGVVIKPDPASSATKKPQVNTAEKPSNFTINNALAACQLTAGQILCGDRLFALTGNRLNSRLASSALTADNLMALPVYNGAGDAESIKQYLAHAYRRYLEKMHDIGLAGVTLTYSKFAFLFEDLRDKGLNFSERFETMYKFLKKDKASMGVSEKMVADSQLTLSDCDLVAENFLVCTRAGRNYLYVARSD